MLRKLNQKITARKVRVTRRYSVRQLLVVVISFAVIGAIALIVSFAVTPANGDFEAETMTLEAL